MTDTMNIGGALRRSIGFYDPVMPCRVAFQHFSLLLHRMLDFIMSVLDGRPTYRHGHVHNLFKTVFCPILSVHLSEWVYVLEDTLENLRFERSCLHGHRQCYAR